MVGEDHTLADPPYIPYQKYGGQTDDEGEPVSIWKETAKQVFSQLRDKEAYR